MRDRRRQTLTSHLGGDSEIATSPSRRISESGIALLHSGAPSQNSAARTGMESLSSCRYGSMHIVA